MTQIVYNLVCNDLLFDVVFVLDKQSISYSRGRYFFHPLGEKCKLEQSPSFIALNGDSQRPTAAACIDKILRREV